MAGSFFARELAFFLIIICLNDIAAHLCVDSHPRCLAFKNKGCKDVPEVIRQQCRLTCGICQHGGAVHKSGLDKQDLVWLIAGLGFFITAVVGVILFSYHKQKNRWQRVAIAYVSPLWESAYSIVSQKKKEHWYDTDTGRKQPRDNDNGRELDVSSQSQLIVN